MRVFVGVAVPVLAAIVQVTVVRFVAVGEVRPDVLTIVVVSWSLAAGAAGGIWWAFGGGLAADLLGSSAFGATTVSLLPIALVFGLRDRSAHEPGAVAGAALVGLAALAHHLAQALVLLVVGTPLPPFTLLAGSAVGVGIYSGVLALIAYPALRALHRRTTRAPAFDW